MSNIDLLDDSILPMALQTQRFAVLERLLTRLNHLPRYAVIMLIEVVDSSSLPYFAKHFSLLEDGWEFAKNEQEQRELIKQAIEIHRHKGTPWAIKRTLKLLGYGDCQLQERQSVHLHDGIHRHNRKIYYGEAGQWTHYCLIMPYAITVEEAERIKNLLLDVAPLRCKLVGIKIPLTHNAVATHNGRYNYTGEISWHN